ncbi:hypothetical protein GCM10010306_003790 [Streptomyces umbrinus]|uniref:DUF397 domain-containing protein n=1 Tax=Streptomyces umbrinus TaxID=67370 RepID=UPI001674C0AB|nr:DUF397 domain-containing protein [Streptomyces umbrinus]GHB15608.1 hypothetical protein GCM10010306_003790 [Streptomyces umbrinus]
MTAFDWFKSSYSSNEGPDCVEVAIAIPDATIHVRDSKDKHGSQLAFTHTAWTEFVGHARRSA